MSEDSGGTTTMGAASNGANHNGPKQRKKKKKNANFMKQEPVKGETPKLTDHVYDTGPNPQNQFASTTKVISKGHDEEYNCCLDQGVDSVPRKRFGG
eukprot:4137858-Ditylum_brightwellii.AAC.1